MKKNQPPMKQPVERSREVEAFLEMLEAERGASRNTLEAYGRDLDDLAKFLARRKQKPAAADAATAAVAAPAAAGTVPAAAAATGAETLASG